MAIQITKRDGLYLLFDTTRSATYKIASTSLRDARATIAKASLSPTCDWLDAATLIRALAALRPDSSKEL